MAATKKTTAKKTAVPATETTDEVKTGDVKSGVLNLQEIKAKDRINASIDSFYVEKCRNLFEPFAKMVQDGELVCSPDSSLRMRTAFKELSTQKTFMKIPKGTFSQLYDSFGSDLRNIIAVCEADIRYEKAWKRLILNLEVSTSDLKSDLGREVVMEKDYGWMTDLAPEALFAPTVITEAFDRYNAFSGRYEIHGKLGLRAEVRSILADFFFGKNFARPHLSKTLPEENRLAVDNFEQEAATDLMALEGIALNGSMLSANGSLSAAALKKVRTNSQMRDFSGTAGAWPLDRVEMLCLTYFTLLEIKSKKETVDLKKLARFAADDMARHITGPIFNTFMPAFLSFTKSWTSESYTVEIASTVREILMAAAYEWMSLDNFKIQLLCEETVNGNNNRYLKLFTYKGRSKTTICRRTDREHEADRRWKVKPLDWFEEMGFKFAVHWIKYLCAIGIVEVAMEPTDTEVSDDPMEGMRFVRLTDLGRYAFGIDKTYIPKTSAGSCGVEFDPRNGIITIDAKSPYQMFFSNIAKKISPTRFSISAASLLKGCKTREELEQRVNNLQTIIDPDKEPALRDMIDEAGSHTDCAEHEGGYSLLKLRADLPGLRQAILSDKELREMTILAGPTLALVKTSKMDRFNTICASLGYLME